MQLMIEPIDLRTSQVMMTAPTYRTQAPGWPTHSTFLLVVIGCLLLKLLPILPGLFGLLGLSIWVLVGDAIDSPDVLTSDTQGSPRLQCSLSAFVECFGSCEIQTELGRSCTLLWYP